jgi:hypothetical protein
MAMNFQKKIFIQTLIAATLFISPFFGLCESKHNIKVQVNYFYPSEQSFQNIYGGGLALGGEMNFKVWKSIYLWLFGSYYSKNGNLPITQEKTKMTLIPVGGGIKLKFQTGIVSPYIGLGPVVYFYEENNPIGVAKGTQAGFIGQAGLSLKIMGRLFFDFSINYSYCKVKPQNIKADIGGIQTGLGIGFMF